MIPRTVGIRTGFFVLFKTVAYCRFEALVEGVELIVN